MILTLLEMFLTLSLQDQNSVSHGLEYLVAIEGNVIGKMCNKNTELKLKGENKFIHSCSQKCK